MIELRHMKIFGKIIIGILGFIVLIIGGYYYYWNNIFYVNYDNIDDIEYAEPSERARNFDLDGYIDSLPQVEYEKIDYPVKETYEYKFNGHKMTIDIPEGFRAYEIPLKKKPKIRNTENLSDSCITHDVCADDLLLFVAEWGISDNKLCITDKKENDFNKCDGIIIYPEKSYFKGISMRDIYTMERSMTNSAYTYEKNATKNHKFLVANNDKNELSYSDTLVSDDLELSFGISEKWREKNLENLFLSMMNSIKIEKE